jgi:hypothetical protein
MFANRDSILCIRKIQEYWGKDNWLSDRYVECLLASGLKVYTFELYLEVEELEGVEGASEEGRDRSADCRGRVSGHSFSLLAGEVGYAIGGVYTSLTGFHLGGGGGSSDDEKEAVQKTEEGVKALSRDFYVPSSSSPIPAPCTPLPPLPRDLARCCGTIQLAALGTWLQASGFSFWNLG